MPQAHILNLYLETANKWLDEFSKRLELPATARPWAHARSRAGDRGARRACDSPLLHSGLG